MKKTIVKLTLKMSVDLVCPLVLANIHFNSLKIHVQQYINSLHVRSAVELKLYMYRDQNMYILVF